MKLFGPKPPARPEDPTIGILGQIRQNPTEPRHCSELADALADQGRTYAAHALERSAAYLGGPAPRYPSIAATEQLQLDHNKYFRFRTLQRTLQGLAQDRADWSILDVGGGDGQLASFVPEAGYFLAEPGVNGLSSDTLPFGSGGFDFVVCCHVLEHIPKPDRHAFLDGLMDHATAGLVLLNPFDMGGQAQNISMQLFVDLADAGWAKEHLDCIMPTRQDLMDWAHLRGHHITLEPNGTAPLSFAAEMLNIYARRADSGADLERINHFLNTAYIDQLDSSAIPTAYQAIISRATP